MGTESTQSPDAVRTQLTKILGSKHFRTSELPTKFLTFVVSKTLEDKGAEIKEYSIGVDAFGRGASFDPRIDSVVRVVARRVRERLAEYYRQEGKDDSLVIEVPTGSYIPSFSTRETTSSVDSQLPSVRSVEQPDAGTDDFLRAPVVENLSTNASLNVRTLVRSKWTWVALVMVLGVLSSIYLAARPAQPPKILSYKQLTRDGQGKLDAFAVGTPAPLLTDGSRIYFNEVSGSQVVIKQVTDSGGETVPLSTNTKEPLVVMNISPDRSELLATDFFLQSPDRRLFVLPLPGGIARPLGRHARALPTAKFLRLSPAPSPADSSRPEPSAATMAAPATPQSSSNRFHRAQPSKDGCRWRNISACHPETRRHHVPRSLVNLDRYFLIGKSIRQSVAAAGVRMGNTSSFNQRRRAALDSGRFARSDGDWAALPCQCA